MTAINDLVSGAIHRIDSIPTSITGSPIMYEFINDARKDVQNITGFTISESSVSETYQSILTNLGAAYTLARMHGVGIDYDYTIGGFRVGKSSRSDPNSKQIDFLLSQANMSLKGIGRKINWAGTFI